MLVPGVATIACRPTLKSSEAVGKRLDIAPYLITISSAWKPPPLGGGGNAVRFWVASMSLEW
jgi:hypothetical protein